MTDAKQKTKQNKLKAQTFCHRYHRFDVLPQGSFNTYIRQRRQPVLLIHDTFQNKLTVESHILFTRKTFVQQQQEY